MTRLRTGRWLELAIWLPVAAYALQVARKFFHNSDRAIYLATDDGVANIAYALATEGRYGFLSSPVLEGMARHEGLFSYGPFYFYLAAGLIWLFGYSLTLLRAIHLGVILAIAVAGWSWFGNRAGRAAAALGAIGLLVAFERGQWPMVRPDSVVSLCAVGLIVCAGLGLRSGLARYWAGAGLFGACGAFTHLVAWGLIPATALVVGGALLVEAGDPHRPSKPLRRFLIPVAATLAGGLAGAAAFYASFGFRIGDQYRFLTGYQQLTGSMARMEEAGASYADLVGRHFDAAYWYLPYPMEYGVWVTLAAAVAATAYFLVRRTEPLRRHVLSLVMPPLVVWVTYLLTLGTFNNFHTGYALLNQVMWLWTGMALVAAALDLVQSWPVLRRVAEPAAALTALALGVGVLTVLAQRTDYRALAATSFASIDEYTDHVLEALPARARAWGAVVFGIEHPTRVQLVQFVEALDVAESLPPPDRAAVAPDYLVWGPFENLHHIREVLRAPVEGQDLFPRRLAALYPQRTYGLVSLTAAAPYGVTRVYAWRQHAPDLPAPLAGVYDPVNRQWNQALAPAEPVALTPEAAGTLVVQPGVPDARRADQTVSGELPEGTYLLRVAIGPGSEPDRFPFVLAAPSADVRATFGESGPDVDISPWFTGEASVWIVYRHAGGRFYVHQYGGGADLITGVAAARVLPLTNYAGVRRPQPEEHALPASAWEASFPEIAVVPQSADAQRVRGNTVQFGYQAYGPRIPVEPGYRMRLRVPLTTFAGAPCIGVLDGTEHRWLLAPERPQPEYEFQINDSRTVKPVLADCSDHPQGVVPMDVIVGSGSYALWSDREELYVDRLMRGFRPRNEEP